MKRLIWSLGLLLLATASNAEPLSRPNFQWEPLEKIGIQDHGRVKPFHTFATESVQYITGSRTWKGMSATEVVFGLLFAYDKEWENEAFIRLDYGPLKTQLGL